MRKDSRKLALCAVVLFLALLSLANVAIMARDIGWPYSFNYNEGSEYATSFGYLYKSLSSYPYLITYYPPLFYLMADGLNYALSLHPYIAERSLSLIAALLDTLMIYLISRKTIKNKPLLQLLPALLFLSPYFMLQLGIIAAPIMFELLFDLVAIYLVLGHKGNWQVPCAALVLIIATLFRQTAIFIFAAVAVYLLLNERKKDAAQFAAVYLLVLIPILLIINLATNGTFLISIFVLPGATPFSLNTSVSLVSAFLTDSWALPLIVLALYWMPRNRLSLLSIATTASLLYVISSLKYGANIYYFAVFYAMLCLASAPALEAVISKKLGDLRLRSFLVIFSAFALLAMLVFYVSAPYIFLPQPTTAAVGIRLRSVTGNILVEEPAVAIAANKTVIFEPSTFWILQRKKLWNDSEIVSSIESKQFGAISFPNCLGRFAQYPQILNATSHYYHLNSTVDGWYIYTPVLNGSGQSPTTVVDRCA